MTSLDAQDFLVLYLALDMLTRHAENELAQAANSTKRMAMLTMRQRAASVRAKLVELEKSPT